MASETERRRALSGMSGREIQHIRAVVLGTGRSPRDERERQRFIEQLLRESTRDQCKGRLLDRELKLKSEDEIARDLEAARLETDQRTASATERAATAAERSAESAALSANESRKSRRLAVVSISISVIALIVSAAAQCQRWLGGRENDSPHASTTTQAAPQPVEGFSHGQSRTQSDA